MDIDSFIAEIIANPDDDTARLIFADYLEENGDPRAEMIRIQFEMAELSHWDPKRAKLRTRELKLLREHGGFGSLPEGVRELGSRGGFLDAVEVTVARFLKCHEQIFAQAPIREVMLKSKSARFNQLATCEGMQRVRRLTLKGTQTNDEQLIDLFRSPNLCNLEALQLRQTGHSLRVAEAVASAPHLTGLRELRLPGMSGDAADLIVNSVILSGLQNLSLGLWNSAGADVSVFADADHFSNLTSLAFSGNISADGLLRFLNSPQMSQLRTLTLGSHRHRDLHSAFEQANPHENIQHATLMLALDNKCVPGLLRVLPNVRTLELGHNSIGEAGAKAIAEHPVLQQLDRLVLTANRVSFAGVVALAESPYRRKGMKLLLRGNQLSRRDVTKLQDTYGKTFGQLGKPREYARSGFGLW